MDMGSCMNTKERILEVLSQSNATSEDICKLTGLGRTAVTTNLKALMKERKVYRLKRGSNYCCYSLSKETVAKMRSGNAKKTKPALPDLPPIMLDWLGYNDKVPDPAAGEIIIGV